MSEVDDFLNNYESSKQSTPAAPKRSEVDELMKSAPPEDKGFLGHAKDLGLSLAKGVVSVPQAAVGLADIPTGGRVGKFLENEGGAFGFRPRQANEFLSDLHTDAYKEQQQQFQNADGVLEKTGVALSNPSLILNPVAESVPSMLGGAAIGRGIAAAAPRVAPVLAAAGGEGAVMAGQQAAQIRDESDNGLLTPAQSGAAVATGALGTVFGYAGGRLAQKLGIGDVDTMLTRGITPQQVADDLARAPAKSIPRQVIEGAISEGFLEELPQSVSEQIIQNLALNKPWSEGVDDAAVMGTLAGMAMGGPAAGFNALTRGAPQEGTQAGATPPAPPPAGPTLALPAPVVNVNTAGSATTADDRNNAIRAAREAEEARLSRIRRGEVLDVTPIPRSAAMGINPADGPISEAAALAVDSGASDQLAQQAALQQAAEIAQQQGKGKAQPPQPRQGELIDGETGEIITQQPEPAVDRADELRQRIEYIQQQARGTGWNRQLSEARDQAMAELAALQPAKPESEAPAPATLQEGIAQVRAEKAETAAAPADIKTVIAKQIPQMTDAELQQAADHYGPDHKRTAKLKREMARRGITIPSSTETGTDGTQAPQAEQAIPQRAQTGAAPAAQPAAPADSPAASAADDVVAAGQQWSTMSATDRQAVADSTDLKGVLRKNVAGAQWDNLAADVKLKLAGAMSARKAKQPDMPRQDFDSTAGVGKISAVQERYGDGKFGVSWASTNIASADTMEEAAAIAKAVAESGAENIADMREAARQHAAAKSSAPDQAKAAPVLDGPQETRFGTHTPRVLGVGSRWAISKWRDEGGVAGPVRDERHPTFKTKLEAQAYLDSLAPASTVDAAANEAATSPTNDLPEPTQAQKEVGNYKKGHVSLQGLDISIENPRGSERSGVDANGKKWTHTMSDHYGYVKRTEGADGDQVDVYVGRNEASDRVFVVDQMRQDTGAFDEHKVMLGFDSQADAVAAYKSNFDNGWKVGPVRAMSMDEFKDWLKNGDTTKPAAESTTRQPPVNETSPSLPPYDEFIAPFRDAYDRFVIAAEKVERPAGRAGSASNWAQIGEAWGKEDEYQRAVDEASAGIEDAKQVLERMHREYRARARALLEAGTPLPESVWGAFRTETWVKKAPKRLKLESAPADRQAPVEVTEGQDENAPLYADKHYDVIFRDPAGAVFDGFALIGKNTDGNDVYESGGIRVVRDGEYSVREVAHKPKSSRVAEFKTVDELGGADAAWWKSMTAHGHREALKAAGVKLPEAVMWHAMSPENQRKVAAIRGTERDPIVQESDAPKSVSIGRVAIGSVLNAEDGTLYRIEGVDIKANKIRATRNPGMASERVVLMDQDRFDRLVREDGEVRAAPAPQTTEQRDATGETQSVADKLREQARAEAARRAAELENRKAGREIERALFRELTDASAGMLGKSQAEIMTAVQERLKARDAVSAVNTINVGRLSRAIHKHIQDNSEKLSRDANRDPQAKAEAIGEGLGAAYGDDVEPLQQANFLLGFEHALSGKTKSTLSGDGLADMVKGYEAAQAWIGTDAGAAWYEGKRRRKLENTGVDLRRHWEAMRDQMKADESDMDQAWKQIEAATNRAGLFAPYLPEGAKPGWVKYVTELRGHVTPFKKWLMEDYDRWYGKTEWRRGKSKDNLKFILEGTRYPLRQDGARDKWETDQAYRLSVLQDAARAYIENVRAVTSFLDGASSVAEASRRFVDLYVAEDRKDEAMDRDTRMPGYVSGLLSETGKQAYNGAGDEAPSVWNVHASDFWKFRFGSGWAETLIEKESTLQLPTKATPLTPPKLDRVTRDMPKDYRKGKDVTPQQFKEAFGFADVGFGNWVGAQNDQDHLNFAYDALMDLAGHFGMSPKHIGLGGNLHFTIGALGHGKHAAFFSPNYPGPNGTVQVINVTNTKGDGTVYHEWGHGLDHNLRGEWPAVRARILDILTHKQFGPQDWEKVADRFLSGGSYWQGNRRGDKVDAAIRAMSYYDDAPERRGATAYKSNADKLGKDYWGNDKELFARAVEAWSSDTLGGTNAYLVNPEWVGDGKVTQAAGYRGTPYPTGDERALFNTVLTALAKSVKWQDGVPVVTKADFEANLPDELFAGEKRRRELLTRAGMQQYQNEAQARREEQRVAREQAQREQQQREREENDRLAAKALSELEPATVDAPPAADASGALSDDELSALFDEAAAELREETQEQPDVPAPGESATSAPTPSPQRAPAARPQASATDKKASTLIAEAAKLGVKGVDEAMTGLAKLFGGSPGRLNSFPAGFDEDTYNKAKPHFKAALTAFQEAGKTLKDLFKLLIKQFGDGVKPYAMQFARDEGLTAQLAPAPSDGGALSPSAKVAQWVRGNLERGEAFDWRQLFAESDRAYGGTQAEAKYTPKDAYDAMEMGVNQYVMQSQGFSPIASQEAAHLVVERLHNLTALLPTQSKRTAEQDEFQQFSTVPALAFAANWAANLTSGDTMLEPSGGVGGLAAFAHNAGARLILNELSSRRAGLLRELFPSAKVYTENAEQIHNILPETEVPSVVVMNPPFSATAGRIAGRRDTKVGAQHVEQALKRLAPGGRLVAIVGEGMNIDRPAFRDWWKKIGAKYDVRAVIPMDGSGYAKYGTTFDNAILVIDKVPPSGRPVVSTPAKTYSELIGLLAEIRDDRPQAAVPASDAQGVERDTAEQSLADSVAQGESGTAAGQPAGDDSVAVGGTEPGGRSTVRAGAGAGGNQGGRGRSGANARQPGTGGRRAGDNAASGVDSTSTSGGGSAAAEGSGVTIEAGAVASNKDLTDSVFESYQPQRLKVPGAQPHPGPLVQSAAMAAVLPPAPTYTPNLPKATVAKGLLSIAQIESVVYAGQAHSEMLEPQTTPSGRQFTPRRGFFIGDGTGVGKGREIGGIILDNLRQGRKKAVWISEKQGLMNDAKRDFKGVGGDDDLIFNQNKSKAEEQIPSRDGIIFTTYSTLRSGAMSQAKAKQKEADKKTAGQSRLDQLVNWLGEDFDGVIAFDEAHNAGNAVPVKGERGASVPSAQALAVVELQQRLPNARVVYVSATGATQVSNLSFATRLGLWGPGTPFPSVESFIAEMNRGGLAAMELVARDIKQMGGYMARSLSYDGVTYSRVEHELTPIQRDIYDRLAEAWQVTLQNMDKALEVTGATGEDGKGNSKAKAAAKSAYWGAQQRFFNQVITSMQMPSVVDQIERDLAAGDAVVLQLVNTNEAQQNRSLARKKEEGESADLEDLDLTPRDMLLQMVQNSFPVVQHQEVQDENGKISRVPMHDSSGAPVLNREAVAMRDKLIEDLQAIRVPDGPLEIVLNHFGHEQVAEVTGRTQRVVRKEDKSGNVRAQLEKRSSSAAKADADAFMADKKRILIFSDAGGTGFSFHADLTAKNQRKRKHYLVQPGWRADKAVQGFGRTHRTNQRSAPHYYLASTNIPAQKRFLSAIARRLDQLGALTKGQRDTANQGMFSERDNLESKYAAEAVRQMFEDGQRGAMDGIPFMEFLRQTGLEDIIDPDTNQLSESKMPTTRLFLNRMLSLKLDMQEKAFEAFINRMDQKIQVAVERGEFDAGMQTIRALETRVLADNVAYTDPKTGAETRLVELELKHATTMFPFPEARKAKREFMVNKRSGRVYVREVAGNETDKLGNILQRFRLHGTSGIQFKNENEFASKDGVATYSTITEEEARAKWAEENAKRPKHYTQTMNMVVGAMLPIWDRLQTDGAINVARTQTVDGERLLGMVIDKKSIADVRKRLNVSSAASQMAPAQVMARILQGDTAELANGWKLERVRVSGDLRIELKAIGYISGPIANELTRMGLISERISWADRYFVPTGKAGVPVLEAMFKNRPVVDLSGDEQDGAQLSQSRSGSPLGITEQGVQRAFAVQFPNLAPAVRTMLARGRQGKRGGAIIIDSDDPKVIAKVFSDRTGHSFDKAVRIFSSAGKVGGFYNRESGLTFLVGPNLDAITAPAVLLHEVYHGQQRSELDAAAIAMLDNRANEKPELQAFLDRVAARIRAAGQGANPRESASYVIEMAVAEGRANGHSFADSRFLNWVDANIGKKVGDLLRAFLASVRQWMLRHGLPIGQITVDDLVNYAKAGMQRAARGDVRGREGYSQRAGTIMVDGVARPTTNSEGRPIASTEQELRNFWRWFGDSKVVDAQGRPLVVYHGSPVKGFEQFDASKINPNDPDAPYNGFWFSSSFDDADGAGSFPWGRPNTPGGGETRAFYLALQNPASRKVARKVARDMRDSNKHGGMTLQDATRAEMQERGLDGVIHSPYVTASEAEYNERGEVALGKNGYVLKAEDGGANLYTRDGDVDHHITGFYDFADAMEQLKHGTFVAFRPEQIKSATGNNGDFDPSNPDINFSTTLASGFRGIAGQAKNELRKTFSAPGKLSRWHTTVGTMYNLAERAPAFKPVFNSAQGFIEDVAYYAADASEMAPNLLPRLETWRDIGKSPVSAKDNTAVAAPIFEGTLLWARDENGKAVRIADLEVAAQKLSADEKASILLERGEISDGVIKMWRGLGDEKFAQMVDSSYETKMLKPGIVWTPGELQRHFKLTGEQQPDGSWSGQIGLYQEFRDATNRSLDTMARADMLRFGGEDVKSLRGAVMDAADAQDAARLLRDHLMRLAQASPDREKSLMTTAQGIMDRAESLATLQAEGYAPLQRFGKYTVDVVVDGERQYFGMFETARAANGMADAMREEFGSGNVTQGILSEEEYKLFAGITPESIELFGNMLGLDSDGDQARDQAFQEYLRRTKTNRSAMRRLIHRKGIAGFSQDVGRVLASFVYSNARQTAAGLNMGDLGEAIADIPKEQGALKDVAVRLQEYIKNPQEEAQAVRGLLFAQYLGGSAASAFVNMTQPIAVTFPWLSQYGGARKASAQVARAAKNIADRNFRYEPDLAAALKKAEEDGVVSPQEVHQLMAQARGAGSLRSGDGTRAGEARALASNAMSRLSLAWGKLFGAAEQLNRRITFIAAYRTAKEQAIDNPAEFARRAVKETQFTYSKANKMHWGRGAVGGTLMTFKTYSIAYIELMHRLWNQGEKGSVERREGRKAAALMVATLLLMGGAGGLPFAEDAEDLIDGVAQLLGYNFSSRRAKEEFLRDVFGDALAEFVDRGVSGLPGAPLDVSGRLGLGNLIPGTGLLQARTSHTRDVLELAGPGGDFAQRVMSGGRRILGGVANASAADIGAGVLELSPVAVRNLAKGVDMAATGMYRDTKGYKVLESSHLEAAFKAAGFQPAAVARIQEANWLNQRAKNFYNLKAQEIRALWAAGIFEKDQGKVDRARASIAEWNAKNPDQPMVIRVPDVMRRVREMAKTKDQRIADTAPKAMRARMREEATRLRGE